MQQIMQKHSYLAKAHSPSHYQGYNRVLAPILGSGIAAQPKAFINSVLQIPWHLVLPSYTTRYT